MVTCIVGLYLVGLGNLSSVHFPRAMNPERVSRRGGRMPTVIFYCFSAAASVPGLLGALYFTTIWSSSCCSV